MVDANSGALRSIDFLSRVFVPVGGVERTVQGFRVTTPWALARFVSVPISRGWWALTSEGEDDELEVRVRDDTGLIFTCRPSQLGAVHLYVGQSTIADVDLVPTPWPGDVSYRRLSLDRLTLSEVAHFFSRRTIQALKGDKPLSRIWAAGRQLISGSNFGSRATASALPSAKPLGQPLRHASPTPQVIRCDQFSYVLSESDELDVRALDVVAEHFRTRPEVMIVYGDIVEAGTLLPSPQWDEERAKWFPIARPPIFFRGRADGLTPENAWDKVRATVRAAGATSSIIRIPLPLASRLAPPNLRLPPPLPIPRRARWPTVSVIIPTKHRTDLLTRCLEGLRTRTDYPDLEIIVVDNGADRAKLDPLLKSESAFHRIVRIEDAGDFNFSRLTNSGVRASRGEVVLLLNDDVIAKEAGWLHRMVDSVIDPTIGAVGARLVYSSGDIQHAGVMLGLGGTCGHLWRNYSSAAAAFNLHVVYPGRRMAVTAACLAVRRKSFDMVGGFDEVNYPVTLNDVDFCLRLGKEGLHNVYRGDAVLLHDESQSRGSDNEQRRKRERRRAEARAFRQMWGDILDDDPYGSPAFDRSTESGAVYIPTQKFAD
jgi:GT2 family glycosyltransferase